MRLWPSKRTPRHARWVCYFDKALNSMKTTPVDRTSSQKEERDLGRNFGWPLGCFIVVATHLFRYTGNTVTCNTVKVLEWLPLSKSPQMATSASAFKLALKPLAAEGR